MTAPRYGQGGQLCGFLKVLALVLVAGATADAGGKDLREAPGPVQQAWKFGVIADTQWTVPDDGRNPGTCAADIIDQVTREIIRHRVDLVVAVGDLTDEPSDANMDLRALYTQGLYNAGIAFFPLRGNHDWADAEEFKRVFPQTVSGRQNATPADALAVANPDAGSLPPAPVEGPPFTVGRNFSSPAAMAGLSYAFDHRNVRFVLLDQFDGKTNTIQPQQEWIASVLASRPPGMHSVVFGHKAIRGAHHGDNLFGDDSEADPAGREAFLRTLVASGVHFYVAGHDHLHDLSRITGATTGGTAVTQLICAAASSKFYLPRRHGWRRLLPNVLAASFDDVHEVPLAQETRTVGYYIFTVDGPRLTVDYYAAPVSPVEHRDLVITTTPRLEFTWRQRFGYALDGREYLVPEGASFTVVDETSGETGARILQGRNTGARRDDLGRLQARAVDTGWTPRACGTSSQQFHLWGMARAMGSSNTDVYVLSLRYDTARDGPELASGGFGLEMRDADGRWLNAAVVVGQGRTRFVSGSWAPGMAVGTWGTDGASRTAWAVLDREGVFRVGFFDEHVTTARCEAELRHKEGARPRPRP